LPSLVKDKAFVSKDYRNNGPGQDEWDKIIQKKEKKV
jgi:hypothetical protein